MWLASIEWLKIESNHLWKLFPLKMNELIRFSRHVPVHVDTCIRYVLIESSEMFV